MKHVVLFALACTACVSPGTALRLSIDSEVPLAALSLALVRNVDAGTEYLTVPADGSAPALPGVLVIELDGADADVDVSLRGVTATNQILTADGEVHCVAEHSCELSLRLTVPRAPIGADCATNDDCATRACANGVCCDRACDDLCETCAARDGALADGTCGVRAAGTTCRAAAGGCDLADSCDGLHPDCADVHAGAGVVCRAAVGKCDVAELCDGLAATCPDDVTLCPAGQFCSVLGCTTPQSNGSSCNDGVMCTSGFCVKGVCCNEACTGTCQSCSLPAGTCHVTSGNVCRASTGACDPAESCDGVAVDCPTDQKQTAKYTTYVTVDSGTGTLHDLASDPQAALTTGCLVGHVGELFATFDTPATSVTPFSVQLVGCLLQGTGAATVAKIMFAQPLDRTDYGAMQTKVTALPASDGTAHVEITNLAPSFVDATGVTQVLLQNTAACPDQPADRRLYGSNAQCTTTSGLQLVVGVCGP